MKIRVSLALFVILIAIFSLAFGQESTTETPSDYDVSQETNGVIQPATPPPSDYKKKAIVVNEDGKVIGIRERKSSSEPFIQKQRYGPQTGRVEDITKKNNNIENLLHEMEEGDNKGPIQFILEYWYVLIVIAIAILVIASCSRPINGVCPSASTTPTRPSSPPPTPAPAATASVPKPVPAPTTLPAEGPNRLEIVSNNRLQTEIRGEDQITVSGGSEGGFLHIFDKSQAIIRGGSVLYIASCGCSFVSMSCGLIVSALSVQENSRVVMTGGRVRCDIGLCGNGELEMTDGKVGWGTAMSGFSDGGITSKDQSRVRLGGRGASDKLLAKGESHITISGLFSLHKAQAMENSQIHITGGLGMCNMMTCNESQVFIWGSSFTIDGIPVGGCTIKSDFILESSHGFPRKLTCLCKDGNIANISIEVRDRSSIVLIPV